ncbi:MAG: hypothetical protein CL787_04405 [Chloroflexi bacterium]|nr:hypothetical protein [Chloroflexota bacterium]
MSDRNPEEKFVTINGVNLRYVDWGSDGKTAMICLHGHTSQSGIFREFAETMSDYYHVYTFDQRGHGGSEWARDGYDRERFVEDLGEIINELGLEKVILVGHSMGGWNSVLYTPKNQEVVEKIILVDIGMEPSEQSILMRGKRPPTPTEFSSFDEAYNWARQNNQWASDDRLRQDLGERLAEGKDGIWKWKADPLLYSTPLRDMEDPESVKRLWDSFRSITCPILEVRGTESITLSDEVIDKMIQANSNFVSVDVHGAAHTVSVDKPEDFITVTKSFLGLNP